MLVVITLNSDKIFGVGHVDHTGMEKRPRDRKGGRSDPPPSAPLFRLLFYKKNRL